MKYINSWQVSFELQLVLGDLGVEEFAANQDAPMGVASTDYCERVALDLARTSGRPWKAAARPKGHKGYLVCPAPALDAEDWPEGAVAGVTLCIPPVTVRAAEKIRREVAEWVKDKGNGLNEEISVLSSRCSWLVRLHAEPDAPISISGLVAGSDELELLWTMGRHSSGHASPQRHAFGPMLLRHLQQEHPRDLAMCNFRTFVTHHASARTGMATDLRRLADGVVELHHFATWAFFDDEHLEWLLGSFLRAAASASDRVEEAVLGELAKLNQAHEWLRSLPDLLVKTPHEGPIAGIEEVTYGGVHAGAEFWNGSAQVVITTADEANHPRIFGQNMLDWREAFAVLALDIAEIRGRGLDPLPLTNPQLSAEIDRLAGMLKDQGLLGYGWAEGPNLQPV